MIQRAPKYPWLPKLSTQNKKSQTSDHSYNRKIKLNKLLRTANRSSPVLMPHVVLHPAALPTTASGIDQVQTFRVRVHRFAAVAVSIPELIMFPLGSCHFGGMFLTPLGTPVLEPHLEQQEQGDKNQLTLVNCSWMAVWGRRESSRRGHRRNYHRSLEQPFPDGGSQPASGQLTPTRRT